MTTISVLLLLLVILTATTTITSTYAASLNDKCFAQISAPTCGASGKACAMLCGMCVDAGTFMLQLDPHTASICNNGAASSITDAQVYNIAVGAMINISALHGYRFMDDTGDVEEHASESLLHLITYMPVRDVLVLFGDPLHTIFYLFDHIRYAYLARRSSFYASKISDALFYDYVLPYAVINEKRDIWWPWRQKLFETLMPSVTDAPNVTEAVHILTKVIPTLRMQGVYGTSGGSFIAGNPVTWRSESSPALLSPQQTIEFGSSCTGTAILLVLACRSVGIAARISGCSESIVAGDDHHWIEFYDPLVPGPFGDNWHTREGVSTGASDGPWDSPSQPMSGCLQGVTPHNSVRTIWSSAWSSNVFLPLLWAEDAYSAKWAYVGGVNRCGAYCTAWGCGVNRDQHYTQAQCSP